MKTLIFMALAFSAKAQAVTQSFFPYTGQQAMVNLVTAGSLGNNIDDDPFHLFTEMMVDPVSTVAGLGKTIQTSDGVASVVCADRQGGNFHCVIMVNKGAGAVIRPLQKQFEYRLESDECSRIFASFKHDETAEYTFHNVDGRLKIVARPDLFLIKYQE